MPKLSLQVRPQIPWTKMPNILVDRLLPELKDTELRVLLVLLRQTTGWSRDGRAVTPSYRLLMKRTGRHSEAVAGALKSLKAKGLIHSSRTKLPKSIRFPKELPSESEQQYKDR